MVVNRSSARRVVWLSFALPMYSSSGQWYVLGIDHAPAPTVFFFIGCVGSVLRLWSAWDDSVSVDLVGLFGCDGEGGDCWLILTVCVLQLLLSFVCSPCFVVVVRSSDVVKVYVGH